MMSKHFHCMKYYCVTLNIMKDCSEHYFFIEC